MSKLSLFKMDSSKLSSLPISEGQFIITLDDKRIYLDDADGQRIPLYSDQIDKLLYIADNATKVETSTKNGYIKINGQEVQVYKAPQDVNTTYSITKSGNTITLTGSDGSTSTVTDKDTTYSNMTGSSETSDGSSGLVPAPTKGNSNRFLSASGNWAVPTNTTYNNATQSAAGLMSKTDKVKLDGIEDGAQVNTVTGVKGNSESAYRTGDINITKANIGLGNVENKSSATIRGELTKSNVTTALGYTPPQNDTNTTYGLSLVGNTISLVEGGTDKEVTVSTKDTTYTLSQSSQDGHIINITSSDGDTQSITIPDNNTTYGLSISGNKVSLVPGGSTSQVTLPDNNTTYTLTQDSTDGHKITLTPSSGTATTITIPDNNTTYGNASTTQAGLMSAADKAKLNGIAEGATNTKDTNTTYTLTQDSADGHKITLTPSTGNATTITIPDNNTTYTGANGISLSGTTFSNSGVRSIATGSANGTISVNTNGTSANVAVKGLGSLAYKSSLSASDVSAIPTSAKGVANGVASLDENGKVPSAQLPAYVDDVLEYSAKSSFPTTGETGKIYVDTSTNKTWRWSGSTYTEISASLALGTTSSTAYRGDYGNTAYTHSQITNGNPHGTDLADLGVTATATELNYVDGVTSNIQTQLGGKAPTSHASSGTSYGVSTASNYGHAKASGTTPKANGTAAVGSETSSFARGDHVHPLQTTVSGNAGSATKLQTARKINGVSFDGSADITVADNTKLPLAGGQLTGSLRFANASSSIDWDDATWRQRIKVTDDSNSNTNVFEFQQSADSGETYTTLLAIKDNSTVVATNFQGTATKATQDSAGQQINTTYIKGLSISGKTITYTKGDNTTGTITTQDTNTTYTAGTGLSLSSNKFSLANTAVTAGSYGPTADVTGNNNSTIKVPQITVDAQGRLTSVVARTLTLKNNTYSNMTAATSSAAGAAGLVPAPGSGKHTSFLRGDATWTIPTASDVGALASTTTYAASSSVGGDAKKAVQLTTSRAIDGINFNGTSAISHYGTCGTDAATAAKTVACSGYTLVTGSRIIIKFTVTNTAAVANLTLNVNSTGAKAIKYRNGNLSSAGLLAANRVYEFIYDGTNYQLVGDINTDNNTTYSAGTGLSLSSNKFSLASGVVTAGTKGPTANVTGSNGATIKVPKVTVDTYGRVTGLEEYTFTAQNTNTNYYPTTFVWTNGTTSGPTGSLTGSGMSAVSIGAIPAANGTTASGIVTTGAQTFGGVKTFSSAPKLSTNTLTTSGGYTVTIPNATATVATTSTSQALTNKTYNGYTLAAACAKGVDTSLTTSSTSTNLPTSKAVASLVSSAITSASGCTTQETSLTCTLPDNL